MVKSNGLNKKYRCNNEEDSPTILIQRKINNRTDERYNKILK